MSTILLICGSRDWIDGDLIYDQMANLNQEEVVIIHGAARGADSCADAAARYIGLSVRSYPAQWGNEGRAAGILRNQRMLDSEQVDEVWAFSDHFETSRGTADMIRRAEKAGIRVRRFSHP